MGDVHQFIDHCLIPVDPWIYKLRKICQDKVVISLDVEYAWQSSLLTWNSFYGQFVNPVRGKEMGESLF